MHLVAWWSIERDKHLVYQAHGARCSCTEPVAKQCHIKGPEKGTLSITCMEELDGEYVKSHVVRVACTGKVRCP